MTDQPLDLLPWVIIEGNEADAMMALWRMEVQNQEALAIFSDQDVAEEYGRKNCGERFRTLQLDKLALVRTLAECHQKGIAYAALNPSADNVSKVFVVRDVLKAARDEMKASRIS